MNNNTSHTETLQHTNPFFKEKYGTPHETAPFDRITLTDYEPAFMEGMKRADELTDTIINNPDAPTFDNTIAFHVNDDMLDRVCNVFFNLLSAETTDEMDALAQKMSPILTEHANKTAHNKALFERVKAVWENHRPLDDEEQMLLEKSYQGFIRSGANLNEEDKEKLREITKKLSALTLQFSQNCLKATHAFELHITDENDLSGLPQTAIDSAASEAKDRKKEGWVFTLEAPSYTPFMTHADNRELRKRMYMERNTLCTNGEYDNREIVKQIVNLRREVAQLLGYNTYADYVLTRRMAQNSQTVYKLLGDLLNAYSPKAKEELDEIKQLAQQMEGNDFTLQAWDLGYYSHKLQLQRYNLDAEMLRPYFELSQVKQGVFGLATTLYGITFKRNNDIPVYHPDVEAYEVMDKDGSFLAVLYADFHPRKSKQSGAWMTSYKDQWTDEEEGDSRPHVSVTLNLTKPTDNKPALLTLGEVETFLHEFGHALHGMFARTRFESLSGTSVYWDFVELPSQFMENYAIEPDFLNTFARHYETHEPIPQELIDRIIASRNFNVASACIRQVKFGLLDMAYYTLPTPFDEDVLTFEKNVWKDIEDVPQLPDTCMSVQFSHIMAGGYAAGYYSYKWAEVLDADAYAVFKQHGIFNRDIAQKFRDCILSKGGTKHPMTLYKEFKGNEPTIEALLKRNNIL